MNDDAVAKHRKCAGADLRQGGNFDDTGWLQPSIYCWTDSAQSRGELGNIPQIEANPEELR